MTVLNAPSTIYREEIGSAEQTTHVRTNKNECHRVDFPLPDATVIKYQRKFICVQIHTLSES